MTTRDHGVARLLRASLTVLLALWLMLGAGVAAASATTDPDEPSTRETSTEVPLLSITVQSTMNEVQSGDEVTYTAVLQNLGASAVEATVVLSVPDYVTLTAGSDSSATVTQAEAKWVRTVNVSGSAEFTIDATIGAIPDTERRVTTLVSVFVGDPGELIVRTADAANIVGVEDLPNEVAQEVAQEAATADDRLWLTVGLIAAAVLFVVLLIATLVVVTRSRRAAR